MDKDKGWGGGCPCQKAFFRAGCSRGTDYRGGSHGSGCTDNPEGGATRARRARGKRRQCRCPRDTKGTSWTGCSRGTSYQGAATGVAAQTTLREGRHGRGGHGGNGGNAAAHGTRREHHGLVAREARAIKGKPREWLHRRP